MANIVCFTNCYLPQEDGSLIYKDLWIDQISGTILDAQQTFYAHRQRPAQIIDLQGGILSPGFLDIQINGAYGFDFSIYPGDDETYLEGLRLVAERIVETGVTSLLPTIITQQRSLYPKLLSLLGKHTYPPIAPSSSSTSPSNDAYSGPGGATLLGWHSEGPFLQTAKRGAHAQPFLVSAPNKIASFEEVYGTDNLDGTSGNGGIRMITAAPEVEGVMESIEPLTKRGVIFSIGHSIATSPLATNAVLNGARLITHLFNAMPQLHHRDPAIIGLLGAGGQYSTVEIGAVPSLAASASSAERAGLKKKTSEFTLGSPAILEGVASDGVGMDSNANASAVVGLARKSQQHWAAGTAEALDELLTPPQTPHLRATTNSSSSQAQRGEGWAERQRKGMPSLAEGDLYARPYYGLIVDGIHSHPNSVRLAYTAHPEGCILVTDAMSFLDPHLPDGPHDWRDGRKVFKQGDKLVIDGTDTLAGSVVTLETCIRNFSRFTSTPLSKALLCATLHPAKCLGIENKKGTLRAGADADLVVLDKDGRVRETWVAGRRVWARQS